MAAIRPQCRRGVGVDMDGPAVWMVMVIARSPPHDRPGLRWAFGHRTPLACRGTLQAKRTRDRLRHATAPPRPRAVLSPDAEDVLAGLARALSRDGGCRTRRMTSDGEPVTEHLRHS